MKLWELCYKVARTTWSDPTANPERNLENVPNRERESLGALRLLYST